MTNQEIKIIQKNYKANKSTQDELLNFVKAYEQYVFKLAHKTAKSRYNKDVVKDLIQAGYVGLFEALKRVDLNKPNKFITYATWWIIKYQKDTFERDHTVRVSAYGIHKLKLKSFINVGIERFSTYEQEPNHDGYDEWLTRAVNSLEHPDHMSVNIYDELDLITL